MYLTSDNIQYIKEVFQVENVYVLKDYSCNSLNDKTDKDVLSYFDKNASLTHVNHYNGDKKNRK